MAIVFFHVQKTGGTTVHSLLQEIFPADRFAERTRAGHVVWDSFRDSDDAIVSGHVTAAEVRHHIKHPRIFTVLREPESRLLSHYYFLKSHSAALLESYGSPLLLRIKAMSLEEFLEDAEIEAWFRDFYVKILDPERDQNGADLHRARAFLSRCEVIGTTDELASFVRAMFAALDIPPPATIPRMNSLSSRKDRAGFDPVDVAAPSRVERELLRKYVANDEVLFQRAQAMPHLATQRPGLLGGMLQRLFGRSVVGSDTRS